MAIKARRGQALIELIVGIFTLALLVSAFAAFAVYIVESLEAQNLNRGDPPKFRLPDDFILSSS